MDLAILNLCSENQCGHWDLGVRSHCICTNNSLPAHQNFAGQNNTPSKTKDGLVQSQLSLYNFVFLLLIIAKRTYFNKVKHLKNLNW